MRDIKENQENCSSTAAELRKIQKPVVEKRRRMRINQSLEQLKSLVLTATQQDFLTGGSRDAKLEKAEILEMTVKYLKNVQRRQLMVAATVDPSVGAKYKSGFQECAEEVAKYMNKVDSLDTDVRMRLMNHLSQCMHGLKNTTATPHSNLNTSTFTPQQSLNTSINLNQTSQHQQMHFPFATALSVLPGGRHLGNNANIMTQNIPVVGRFPAQATAVNVMLGNGQVMPCFVPTVNLLPGGNPTGNSIGVSQTNMADSKVKQDVTSPFINNKQDIDSKIRTDYVRPDTEDESSRDSFGETTISTRIRLDSDSKSLPESEEREVDGGRRDASLARGPADDDVMWRPW